MIPGSHLFVPGNRPERFAKALASRAAGLAAPVAGVAPDIVAESKLLADLARARSHDFGAKLCIHPKQVAPSTPR